MPESPWDAIWSNAERRFGLSEDWTMFAIILAAALLVAAVGLGLQAVMQHREKSPAPRHWRSWLLPVLAVVVFVAASVMFGFTTEGPADQLERPGEAELGEPVEVIQAFPHDDDGSQKVAAGERPPWFDVTPAVDDWRDGAGAIAALSIVQIPPGERSRRQLIVRGQQFPEKARARQDALEAAVKFVRQEVAASRGLTGEWELSPALVQTHAVKDTFVEPIKRTTGVNDFYVYRAYHLIELSPEVEEVAYLSWREQIVEHRLWILGGLFGFATLLTGTAAAYLRLDSLTGGSYRGRLKLASVSLVTAGGLGLAALLPMA